MKQTVLVSAAGGGLPATRVVNEEVSTPRAGSLVTWGKSQLPRASAASTESWIFGCVRQNTACKHLSDEVVADAVIVENTVWLAGVYTHIAGVQVPAQPLACHPCQFSHL